MNGRPSSQTSASAPTSRPVCSSDHRREVPAAALDAAARERPLRVVAARRTARRSAPPPVSRMNTVNSTTLRSAIGQAAQRSRTYSLVTPGPSAKSTPCVPGGLLDHVGQHVQHRRRRQVADRVERPPARLEVGALELQPALERLEHPRAARMRDPGADVVEPEVVVGQQFADVVPDVRVDGVGDRGGQHDPESGAADVPADDALAVGVELAAGSDDLGAGQAELGGAPVAGHDDRGRAVAEQPARHEVGDRVVVALEGERAELDRDEQGDLVRVPEQVVVHAGQPRGAGDASEAERRHPLDVGAQPEHRHEPGVDRRGRDAGHRREEQVVDVGGLEAGRRQRGRDRLRGERGALADPDVVGGAEITEVAVALERQHGVPASDAARRVEALEHGAARLVRRDEIAQLGRDLGLGVRELGEGGGDRHDSRHSRTLAPGHAARPGSHCGRSGTCRSSGPTYSDSGRMRALASSCSMTWAVQPVTRDATKSGVNSSVSKPIRWYAGPLG